MVSRRRVRIEKKTQKLPNSLWVVIFVVIVAGAYTLGAFNNQIFSAIAPIFGAKSYAGTLDVSSLQSTYQALKANFAGTLDDQKLIDAANKGLVSAAGDQYTVYMTKSEYADFNNSLTGNIGGGIGVELGTRNNLPTIVRVLANNPAGAAGVMVGDVVTALNDQSTSGKTLDQVVASIRGDVGTTLKLTVSRAGETKDFTITRAQVDNPSVYSSVSDGIGIMTITSFDDQTGELARAAAQQFKNQNVKGVILDLRDNGGGYITAAQDVAGLWLNNQIVVTERNNNTILDQLRTGSDPILAGIPTVVLVNGNSASASEIVSGALRDDKAATLVGEKTFGKGSVQKLISLPEGAELKVTVAKWYTPNGTNVSGAGFTPDKVVSISQDDLNAGRDPQLDAAKALLNN